MELSDVLDYIIECDSQADVEKIFNASEFRLGELNTGVDDDLRVELEDGEDDESDDDENRVLIMT